MSATPRISIAMATYNGARYIREQLDSLANQTLLRRLREAGQAKAQSFSWDSIAREQLAMYAQRLEEKHR